MGETNDRNSQQKRSTKREAAIYREQSACVRACVRACNVRTINDGIACVTSRTSEGCSSSTPPLENSEGTRRLPAARLRVPTA